MNPPRKYRLVTRCYMYHTKFIRFEQAGIPTRNISILETCENDETTRSDLYQ